MPWFASRLVIVLILSMAGSRLLAAAGELATPSPTTSPPTTTAPAEIPGEATGEVSTPAAQQQFLFAYRLFQRSEDKLAADAFDDYIGQFPRDPRQGDARYFRAILAQRSGDAKVAVSLLTDLPEPTLVPPSAPPILLGQILVSLGRHQEALAVLEAIKTDDLDKANRATVLHLRGLAYHGLNNLDAAAKQLAAAGALETPAQARALLDLGRIEALRNKPDAALAVLGKAIAFKDPLITPAAAQLAGDLAYRKGDYKAASESYRLVTTGHQTSASFAPSVVGLLWSRMSAGLLDTLLAEFQQYKSALTGSELATATYLAGTAQQDLGRHEQAAALFTESLKGVTDASLRDRLLLRLATCRFELGQYDDMEKSLEGLLKESPQTPLKLDAEILRASAEARQGDTTKGITRLTQMLAQGQDKPGMANVLLQRARLYELAKQTGPAAADYEKFLSLAKNNSTLSATMVDQASLRLADLSLALEKPDKALAITQGLLARDNLPAQVEQEALYQQMLALLRQGKSDAAYKTVQTLFEKHPQNSHTLEARYYRGLLLLSLKKPDDAVADLTAVADARVEGQEPLKMNALRLVSMTLREKDDTDSRRKAADMLLRLNKLALDTGQSQAGLTQQDLLWLGRFYIAESRPREALRYLAPLLEQHWPAEGTQKIPVEIRSTAVTLTARCLRSLGDLPGAIVAYKQAIALGGVDMTNARLELAKTLRDADQLDEALSELAPLESSRDAGVAVDALFTAGSVQRQLADKAVARGDLKAASAANEAAYGKFLKIVVLHSDPAHSPLPELSYVEMAAAADARGDTPRATKALAELAKEFPDTAYAQYAQAGLKLLQASPGAAGEARHILQQLVKDHPKLDPALQRLVDTQVRRLEALP